MNKNSLLKKVGIGALTTAIVASQFVSTIPYNVLADQVQTNQTNVPSVTSTIDKSTTTSTKTKPVVGATVGDSGDIQLDTSLNNLSAWGAIVSTFSTNKFVYESTDHYDGSSDVEDNYTIDGAQNGHYLPLASIMRNTEYGTMVSVKAGDYPTAGTQGLGQVFNTVPGRTYSFTYTALGSSRTPARYGVIAFSNYTGGLLQNLEHSNPLAKSYIPELQNWGDTYTDTVTFTATGNQTYLQILMSPNGGELFFPKLGTIENVTKDTTPPEITASDKTLTVGDSFDPKADVTANDDTDGDITSKIEVTSNNVDTSKAGTYNVTYSVTDAAGNNTTKTITITVNDAPDTTKPEITASDKTLTVGDSFDPKADVTASDDKDGDITSKIQVTSNNVDTSKAGTYNVTYSVTDAAGNTATKKQSQSQ
ncbi:immunoglobulin-like domain-containing protein [Listeria riparia]|uniref:Putative peptidoglycan linked protein n=1 Tax=Listeria riparia FSL S10-1204 TaxID=1265816 RepID=W7DNV7_9LIST|nr:immunoglobulin-like domain-containing protein [Listeria riparia]EUJ47003.1 putative peptidoglycan linked protein [Listeria riparia FSL S10-1204]